MHAVPPPALHRPMGVLWRLWLVITLLLVIRFILLAIDPRVYMGWSPVVMTAWSVPWFSGHSGLLAWLADTSYQWSNPWVWPVNALLNAIFSGFPFLETAYFPSLPGFFFMANGALPGVLDWGALLSIGLWAGVVQAMYGAWALCRQLGWVWLTEKTYSHQQQQAMQQQLLEQHKDRLVLSQDVATLSQAATLLRAQTLTDAMTGLYNKRFFQQKTTELFADAVANGRPLGLLMLDIDFFKKLNDTYGHQVGDEALKAVAHLMQKYTPKGSFACRYGGEEFGIVMPAMPLNRIITVADTLRQAVSDYQMPDQPDLKMTISQGLAWFHLQPATSIAYTQVSQWIEAADAALYKAKQSGRNRLVVNS
ncbi:MAG: GGDEF domain-containing protein [Vampirovibrionales bacterium]